MSKNDIVRSGRIAIGIIRKPIGLQGVCAVEPLGKTFEQLSVPIDVFIGSSEYDSTLVTLEAIEFRPKGPVCQFSGVGTAEQVEALRDSYIYMHREQLSKLEGDTYYHFDLVGLKVRNEQGKELGSVVAVHNFPSVDSVEVATGRDTVMIPLTADAVMDINQTSGYLTICTGFLEELL